MSPRTHSITHVHTVTNTHTHFVWGLVESHGGLYSSVISWWKKESGIKGNSQYEIFLKTLLMLGRNFAVLLCTL